MPTTTGDQVSRRLEEELDRRLDAAIADACALLGDTAPPRGGPLGAYADALVDRLVATGDVRAGEEQEAHRRSLARLTERSEARLHALERIDAAVARLREITAPAAMLASAPAELCASSDLRRAVISSVRDGVLTAEAMHVDDDPGAAAGALEALRAEPVRLAHPLVETEVMRRRRATVVSEAAGHPKVHGRTAAIMQWGSYAAAPVVVRSTVIALLHADRGPGTSLDIVHGDVLWAFASGLARSYESASLRRTLRHEREQMRQFLAWLDARSGELADSTISLDARPEAELPATLAPIPGRTDTTVFDGVLTRRELEVLRLLGDGFTNRAIAEELFISTGTVKFHVNRILTKLRVANRAEAVSRYYALLGTRRRG